MSTAETADGPFEVLSAAFDRDGDRQKPLSERQLLTDALEELLADVIAVVRPDVFFEVGAFEASFSRQMRATYPEARVVAFEANPRVHERFATEVETAGVTYVASAIGNTVGTARFFIPEVIAGKTMPTVGRMGSLHPVGARESRVVEVETPITTLDLAAGDVAGRNVCLWIDVEGAVDQVLAGGPKTLEATSLVYCELESRPMWQGQTLSGPVIEYLVRAGFVPLVRDCQKWFQFNALFVRPSYVEALRGAVEAYVPRALALYGQPA